MTDYITNKNVVCYFLLLCVPHKKNISLFLVTFLFFRNHHSEPNCPSVHLVRCYPTVTQRITRCWWPWHHPHILHCPFSFRMAPRTSRTRSQPEGCLKILLCVQIGLATNTCITPSLSWMVPTSQGLVEWVHLFRDYLLFPYRRFGIFSFWI